MHNPHRLKAALAYASHGWLIIPVRTAHHGRCSCGSHECVSPAKHPHAPRGLRDASTDAAQIRAWWQCWPGTNIGIRTGAVSGLVVVDIDPRNGGDVTLEELEAEHGRLPDTVESLAGGGGRHLLYRHPGEPYPLASYSPGPGVDLKADGGYIVAPPLGHASGRPYTWELSREPDVTPLAPAPAWIPFYDPADVRQAHPPGTRCPHPRRGQPRRRLSREGHPCRGPRAARVSCPAHAEFCANGSSAAITKMSQP
jgi:Bifunctional DNA primase/polymerase, N-terminal